MQNQFGTIEPGENPARVVDIPVSTNGTDRVSRTARTAAEASATPDSRIPTIEQAVKDGKLSYVPVSNQDAAQRATDTIQRDGWSKALTDWTAEARAGKTSADLTAMGATLLNNAGNSSMTGAQYAELLSDYAGMLRSGGQAVQAARILKRLSPEGRLYMIQKSAESIAKDISGSSDVTIDPALIDEYRAAGDDAQRDAVIVKMQQNIADQMPSTLSDKFTALRYVNMLGNFKTQVRNIAGNAGMQPVRIAKDKIGAVLEEAASAATGGKVERTKSFLVSPSMVKQAWADFESVQNEALGEGKYQNTTDQTQRDIQDKRTIFKNNGDWGTSPESNAFLRGLRSSTDVGWRALEGYRKATNWAMEHGDVGFSRFTYADTLAGYLQANGVKSIDTADPELLDKARAYAIQQAQEATYRDTNAFSKRISQFDRNWSETGKKISQGLLPFRKTPANVLARAEEYSPLGIVNTAYEAVQAKKGNASAADVIDSLSKTITGTGLAALGYALFNGGLLRGKDDDDKRQAGFDDLLGHQAYALELPGGKSVTLDWLAPESMPFFMGAQFAKEAAENGLSFSDGLNALSSITDPMLQMSMLQGVNDALDQLQYGSESAANAAKFTVNELWSYLTQGISNSLLGQAERSSEPVRMTTYADKNSGVPTEAQYMLGKLSAKTPGWDYQQIPYIDAWGRTDSNGSQAERVFNNFLNPSYVSDVKVRPVEQELQRLADQTGSTAVFPQRADTYFNADDGKKVLTGKEYETYAKALGQNRYSLVQEAVSSSAYKGLDDDGKADLMGKLYEYANAKAKQSVAKYTMSSEMRKAKEAEDAGMSPAQYFIMRATMDTDGSGSVSQKEAKAAIDRSGVNNAAAAKVWTILNSGWKTNPYRK
jgi:hypothetical protein